MTLKTESSYLLAILLDVEFAATDIARHAIVTELARLEFIRIVNHRWTMLQRADGFVGERVVNVPSGKETMRLRARRRPPALTSDRHGLVYA